MQIQITKRQILDLVDHIQKMYLGLNTKNPNHKHFEDLMQNLHTDLDRKLSWQLGCRKRNASTSVETDITTQISTSTNTDYIQQYTISLQICYTD